MSESRKYQLAWAAFCAVGAAAMLWACYTVQEGGRPTVDQYPTILVVNDGITPVHVYVEGIKVGVADRGENCLPLRNVSSWGVLRFGFQMRPHPRMWAPEIAHTSRGYAVRLGGDIRSWKWDLNSIQPAARCERQDETLGLGGGVVVGTDSVNSFYFRSRGPIIRNGAHRLLYAVTAGCLGVAPDLLMDIRWEHSKGIFNYNEKAWIAGLYLIHRDGSHIIILDDDMIYDAGTITHESIHALAKLYFDPLPDSIRAKCEYGYQ
jgi:hypothetical protein